VSRATEPRELALFGGVPAFPVQKHVGSPNIGDRRRLLQRMEDILDRRWLTNGGPYVQEFEKRIGAMLGVKHCIAMCNATIGLEIAIRRSFSQPKLVGGFIVEDYGAIWVLGDHPIGSELGLGRRQLGALVPHREFTGDRRNQCAGQRGQLRPNPVGRASGADRDRTLRLVGGDLALHAL